MRRPVKLRVIGKWYRVRYLKRPFYHKDGDELYGECDLDKHAIRVQNGLEALKEREIVLHESMHAVEAAMGIKISEADLTRMAAGVLALLTDNPEFAQYLISKDA